MKNLDKNNKLKNMVEQAFSKLNDNDLDIKPFYIVATYKNHSVQISFSEEDSVMLIIIAKLIPENVRINPNALNTLNNETSFGTHLITNAMMTHRFYVYRVACWNLGDDEPNEEAFITLLDNGCAEAEKGYEVLVQQNKT